MYPTRTRHNRKEQDFYKEPSQSAQLVLSKLPTNSQQQKNQTLKKVKAIAKRKAKEEPSKQTAQKTQAQNSSVDQNSQLKSQQSANNSHIQAKQNEPSNYFQEDFLKEAYQLQKIVRKPNYIKVEDNLIIKGYSGHSSLIFKRPILQGSYYFQVKILKPLQNDQNLSYPSSVRIGLCPYDYPHTVPLGGKGSIGYRSIDGNMIENKKAVKFGPSFGVEDLIGVQLKIGPPHKHPVKQQRNEESKITFYKNKEKVGQYENLKQIFYTVGISLFNFAVVELRIHQNNIQALPEGFQPYIQNLNKEIPYKDLKTSRIFNQ